MKNILCLFFVCLSVRATDDVRNSILREGKKFELKYSFEGNNGNNDIGEYDDMIPNHPLTDIFNGILNEEYLYITKNIKVDEESGKLIHINNNLKTIDYLLILYNLPNNGGKDKYKNMVLFPTNSEQLEFYIANDYKGNKSKLILDTYFQLVVTIESIREIIIAKTRENNPSKFIYNVDETTRITLQGGYPTQLHSSSGDITVLKKVNGEYTEDYQYIVENRKQELAKSQLVELDKNLLEKEIRNILRIFIPLGDNVKNVKLEILLKGLAMFGTQVVNGKMPINEYLSRVYGIYRLLSKYIQDHPVLVDSFQQYFDKNIRFFYEILPNIQPYLQTTDLIPAIYTLLETFKNISSGQNSNILSNYKISYKDSKKVLDSIEFYKNQLQ